jgi:hypothetical protein
MFELRSPYVVNITSVNDFTACPWRWWAKWIQNRVPIHDSVPLTFGKMGHIIFEDVHKGLGSFREVIQSRRAEWHEQMIQEPDEFNRMVMQKALQTLDDMAEALPQWKDGYEFEIPCLEIEQPFEYKLMPGIILHGRPDRVGVMAGQLWHCQHKFLAAGTHFGTYIELAKRNYHEHSYLEALHLKYPQYPIGGTLFDLIRKLKFRTNIGKKNEATKTYEEMFMQFPMSISLDSPLHQHVMENIKAHIKEMRRVEVAYGVSGVIPAPNEGANGGYFHNQPDDYFYVLTGERSLDDDRYFKPRQETYVATEKEE